VIVFLSVSCAVLLVFVSLSAENLIDDWDTLCSLTEDDLKEVIPAVGLRRKVMSAICQGKSQQSEGNGSVLFWNALTYSGHSTRKLLPVFRLHTIERNAETNSTRFENYG